MQLGHLAGEAEPFQPPHQEDERVAVFREDEQFLVLESVVPEHLAELVELRLVTSGLDLAGQLQQGLDL